MKLQGDKSAYQPFMKLMSHGFLDPSVSPEENKQKISRDGLLFLRESQDAQTLVIVLQSKICDPNILPKEAYHCSRNYYRINLFRARSLHL